MTDAADHPTVVDIEIVHADQHGARTALTVGDSALNIMGVCHGGIIFTLADTAMERASNADDSQSVAVHAEIDFVRPAKLGERLLADATVVSTWGRTKLIDVHVTDQATGETVAFFRGRTRSTRR